MAEKLLPSCRTISDDGNEVELLKLAELPNGKEMFVAMNIVLPTS